MCGNLLFTGRPGIGKTTLVRSVLRLLRARGVEGSGFFTEEVLDGAGGRRGFRYHTLSGRVGPLAERGLKSGRRVGSYGVTLQGLEREALPEIDPDRTLAPLIVVDEFGKMEAFSALFREAAGRALDSPRVVLATISLGGGAWLRRVRERSDIVLTRIGLSNRDRLVAETAEAVLRLLADEKGARRLFRSGKDAGPPSSPSRRPA